MTKQELEVIETTIADVNKRLSELSTYVYNLKRELDVITPPTPPAPPEPVPAEPDSSVSKGTKILLDEICEGEGTSIAHAKRHGYTSEYDITFAYGAYLRPPKPITTMTIRELYVFQRQQVRKTRGKIPGTKYGTSAAGKYQIIRPTLVRLVKKLKLSEDTLFDAATQDLCGLELLNGRGYQKYLSGRISTKSFQTKLAAEWASIAMPGTGKSKYGQATGTSTKEIQAAMKEAKRLQ